MEQCPAHLGRPPSADVISTVLPHKCVVCYRGVCMFREGSVYVVLRSCVATRVKPEDAHIRHPASAAVLPANEITSEIWRSGDFLRSSVECHYGDSTRATLEGCTVRASAMVTFVLECLCTDQGCAASRINSGSGEEARRPWFSLCRL